MSEARQMREAQERGEKIEIIKTPNQLATPQALDKPEAFRRQNITLYRQKNKPKRIPKPPRKTPTGQPTPGKRTIINLTKAADKLYGEAGYTKRTSLAQKPVKPTFNQMKARLGLAIIEPIIGGVEEGTFGIGTISQSRGRPVTAMFRGAGALLTPTAADIVAGVILTRSGATKLGRGILKKADKYLRGIGDPILPKLTAAELDEVRQWEKMGGGLTHLRRTAQKNPKLLKTIDEVVEYYKKNPAQFSAGASVVPEGVHIFDKIAYDFDMDAYDLVNFINKNDDLFIDGSVLSSLIPTLSNKDAHKVLEETTSLPKDLIDNVIEQMRKAAPKQVTRTINSTELATDEDTKTAFITDTDSTQKTHTTPRQSQTRIPVQALDVPQIAPTTTVEPIPVTPPIILTKDDESKRRKMNPRFYSGPEQLWRVKYYYKKGKTETITIPAKSLIEAMNRAQRTKRIHSSRPHLVDIKRTKR